MIWFASSLLLLRIIDACTIFHLVSKDQLTLISSRNVCTFSGVTVEHPAMERTLDAVTDDSPSDGEVCAEMRAVRVHHVRPTVRTTEYS